MFKPYLNEDNLEYIVSVWGEVHVDYIHRVEETFRKAMQEYPRLLVVRVDFRFPSDSCVIVKKDSGVITRTMKSLDEKISADSKRKKKRNERVYPCRVRYIWVREFGEKDNKHYHVLLLLNKDAYHYPGSFKKKDNLSYMIKTAWCSAIGVAYDDYEGLVEFPQNCYYWVKRNNKLELETFDAVMFRTSYFAKMATKVSGDGERNFGCSQK
ncbi:inovirus Gp2 family protein [Budvicia aquatica]|uniref:Protein of uncharacterized function (DUF3296) n=1 Tax=Budvicia aquatica TaxID=82979 RepID=A0A2C6DN55_9GAMM|nr:inovirus Gp2 family protein [Budvicia aquatica]PHI31778.1 hypothetical protein CRN84_21825 [Budvicia aquatica]VFS52711.1 Protein of uncharacterised function (DUF3296) [Budvicia aquatica]